MKRCTMDKPGRAGAAAAFALLACAVSASSWSTRVLGLMITGQVTSMPAAGQIEVDHHAYRVKSGTSADRNLRSFHMGQVVDLELDGPAATKNSEVVSIAPHTGS